VRNVGSYLVRHQLNGSAAWARGGTSPLLCLGEGICHTVGEEKCKRNSNLSTRRRVLNYPQLNGSASTRRRVLNYPQLNGSASTRRRVLNYSQLNGSASTRRRVLNYSQLNGSASTRGREVRGGTSPLPRVGEGQG
jgi:hypothetical protein